MKKVIAILLAGALVVGGAVTAFAAPSPSASTTVTVEASENSETTSLSSYTLNGVDDDADVELVKDASFKADWDKTAAAEIKADPEDALAEAGVDADEIAEVDLVDVFDLRLEGEDIGSVTFPITVTFKVPYVTSSSKVIVLHYLYSELTGDEGWQQETAVCGDGTVTVTLNSLSPIAIFVDEATAKKISASAGSTSSTDSTGSTSGTGTTSPKTGEAPIATAATMIALCAVVGLAVSSRRRHA